MHTEDLKITHHLHPTKGWRKGEPPTMKFAALKYSDGTRQDARPVARIRKRVTGGMFKVSSVAIIPKRKGQ